MPRVQPHGSDKLSEALRRLRDGHAAVAGQETTVIIDPNITSTNYPNGIPVVVLGYLLPDTGIDDYGLAIWDETNHIWIMPRVSPTVLFSGSDAVARTLPAGTTDVLNSGVLASGFIEYEVTATINFKNASGSAASFEFDIEDNLGAVHGAQVVSSMPNGKTLAFTTQATYLSTGYAVAKGFSVYANGDGSASLTCEAVSMVVQGIR
jgi:hypothetical protein